MNEHNKVLVTIIVSIYNGQLFLRECIDSIINQDYDNVEIILINDGSTDDSQQILDEYDKKFDRIKVIHKKNEGVSVARNVALNISSGDYIGFVDQDDKISKDYISYQMNLIEKYNAEMSLIPHVIKFTKDREIYQESRNRELDECWTGEKAACQMLYDNIEIGPWNKIIKRSILEENSIRFLEWAFGGEGYAFSVQTFQCCKRIAVGYKGIYYYRVDNTTSGMSTYRANVAVSSINAIKYMSENKMIESVAINNAIDYAMWNVYYVMLTIMIRANSIRDNYEQYKQFLRKCRKCPHKILVAPISYKRKILALICIIDPRLSLRIATRHNTLRQYQ